MRHMRQPHRPKPYYSRKKDIICRECEGHFHSKFSLRRHQQKNHTFASAPDQVSETEKIRDPPKVTAALSMRLAETYENEVARCVELNWSSVRSVCLKRSGYLTVLRARLTAKNGELGVELTRILREILQNEKAQFKLGLSFATVTLDEGSLRFCEATPARRLGDDALMSSHSEINDLIGDMDDDSVMEVRMLGIASKVLFFNSSYFSLFSSLGCKLLSALP
jgi:hypothetical protein